MLNYVAFLCGGIAERGATPTADGVEMANKCLQQLEATGNPEQFPPRLLILLTSPAYQKEDEAKELLASIHKTVADYKSRIFASEISKQKEPNEASLIGCSVDAVFFNREVHERGALLICLASRLIEAEIHVTHNVQDNYEQQVEFLLGKLGLSSQNTDDKVEKALTDRLMLAFLPNTGRHEENSAYLAPELHRLLREKSGTNIPIIGGVSAKPSFQFSGSMVYPNELVAARIFTGAPFSSCFGHGLNESVEEDIRVKTLATDGHIVHEFDQLGSPAEILNLKSQDDFALLGELSLSHDPKVTVAQITSNKKSVTLLRKIKPNALFRRLTIESPNQLRDEARKAFERSLMWWLVERPIGCLAMHCSSRRRYGENIKDYAEDVEAIIRRKNNGAEIGNEDFYFGGFFDGEFGTDKTGRSQFGNWCIATLCFNDEMRAKTPAYTGFKAISEYASSLTSARSLEEALPDTLKVIFDTGFPGAMISLLMKDGDEEWLVARQAIGKRFNQIVDLTKRPKSEKKDILALVTDSGEAEFIPDSKNDCRCDQIAVKKSRIVSQYVLPLFDRKHELIAVLQFDLGDLRRRVNGLDKTEERILKSLGAVVEGIILRVLNREETDLASILDFVLRESLRATEVNQALQVYIDQAVKFFKVEMGHIRLLNSDEDTLEMVAGTGGYYEAFKMRSPKRPVKSDSPTAMAFQQKGVVVVNESEKVDGWQQSVLNSCQDDIFAFSALQNARSFANVAIKDGSGNPIGTISLISNHPWYFTRSRVNALLALSQLASYLLEHFKVQKERQFLFGISSDFVHNADFTEPTKTINETVQRLRIATNADWVSLFIWDKEAERFILRAQDGCEDNRWVNAAGYKMGEGWIGNIWREEAPQYVPDFYDYKKRLILPINEEYETHLFKQSLSKNFTVEAIGLPLRLKQVQPIGVLTLFRQIDSSSSHHGSGFTITNQHTLQEAANTISAMLSALLHNQQLVWLKQEVKRQEEIRDAMEKGDPQITIEQRLCNKIVESFDADRAVLYLASGKGKKINLEWAAESSHLGGVNQNSSEPDRMLISTARAKKIKKKKRDRLSDEERRNPEKAKTEGLLERIILPLQNESVLVGFLDIIFNITQKNPHLMPLHDSHQFEELAEKIASVYEHQKWREVYEQKKEFEQKEKAEAIAERSKLAMQAMSAMIFQTAHRLMNLTQSIRSLGILIEKAKSVEEQSGRLSELFKLTGHWRKQAAQICVFSGHFRV